MILGLVVMTFRAFLRRLRNEESGQDLAEYCLLTALLTLAAAAIFVQASGGIQAVWNGATVSLTASQSAATANTSTGAGSSSTTPAGK
jgi:Flp pilus assembly pilin Flp